MSLNQKQIENLHIVEKLEKEKEKIENILDHFHDVTDLGDTPVDESQDTDSAEEHNQYFAVKETLEDRLENIEKSLDKIEKGNYGDCEECGESISVELLKVDPESQLCKECKKKKVREE